jgi:hypothetical protein
MKKIVLAVAAAVVTLSAIAPAQANEHHRECHKVRVHHHWEKRCHSSARCALAGTVRIAKPRNKRGFFLPGFDAALAHASTLYTFHAKTAVRNHRHMLLHLGGAGRRAHGFSRWCNCEKP